MNPPRRLTFGPFCLDLIAGYLRRGDTEVPLRPQTFAVLRYLVERPNQVVSPETLYQQVWRGAQVSRSALRVSIREIRTALGDAAQASRYLETVRGRGYRFIGALEGPWSSAGGAAIPGAAGAVVGRQWELAQLSQWLEQTRLGQRQLVLISGVAGIGKTTLVDTFLGPYLGDSVLRIGRGQCIEHYGEGEAYLPVLEALGRLGRAPGGASVLAMLRQVAPSWLVHLPALLSEAERQQRQHQDITPQQMLRELAEALEALSLDTPLVLVLEDLHWSDPSTIDLLASVARRREAAKLLILGTYRPSETQLQNHPLRTHLQELRAHGQAVELALTGFDVGAVMAYGVRRLAAPLTLEAGAWLLRRSAGNALFLVHLVEHLVQRGALVQVDGHWALHDNPAVWHQIPQEIQLLLDRQLGQLPPAVQQVLEVASVVGETFTAAAVAAGVQHEVEAIDRLCAAAVRLGRLLEADGLAAWPDGTVSGQYRFAHALVRQVAYERVGVGPRAALHARIGARLEQAYGSRVADIAATLAVHFLQSQDAPRAIQYLQMAAEQSLSRSAYPETITHCSMALELLPALPETPERAGRELNVLIALRSALVPMKGYSAPEVAAIYQRAQVLCDQLEEGPQLVLALGGLVRFYWHIRTEVQPALQFAEQQHRLAQRLRDPTLLLRAQCNLGPLLYTTGACIAARDVLEQAVHLCDTRPLHTARTTPGWSNYVVESRGYLALTLWYMGYPDQACAHAREGLALAHEAAQPFSLALALMFAGILSGLLGDTQAALVHAASLLTLATAQGYPHWVAIGTILQGSALARAGQGDDAIALMSQGIEAHQNLTVLGLARYLFRLAEVYGQVGRLDQGLAVIAEAMILIERTGEQVEVVELHRLQGELLRARSRADVVKAESCFEYALEVSRSQHAKSLELRAAMSLSRLWQEQSKSQDAYALLVPVYDWFTEGFDTADLQDAKALLDKLSVEMRSPNA